MEQSPYAYIQTVPALLLSRVTSLVFWMCYNPSQLAVLKSTSSKKPNIQLNLYTVRP